MEIFSRWKDGKELDDDATISTTRPKKSPTFLRKSPTFFGKSPTFFGKSPTFLEKTPTFFGKSPTFLGRKVPTVFYILLELEQEGRMFPHKF